MNSTLQNSTLSKKENVTTDIVYSSAEQIHELLHSKTFPIYIPAIIFTIILLVIGVPGNSIVVYTYFRKWGSSSTRTFILSLAVLDLINCVFSLPMEIVFMSHPLMFDNAILCKLARFITYGCNTTSALFLTAIAVDRYQRICKPLKDGMTSKFAKRTVYVSLSIAGLTLWPIFLLYGTRTIMILPNVEVKICSFENQYVNTPYPLAFFIFHCVCTLIIFLIFCVLYSYVGIQACRHRKFRSKSRSLHSLSEFSVDEDDRLYLGNKHPQIIEQKNMQNGLSEHVRLNNERNGSTADLGTRGKLAGVLRSTADKLQKARKSVFDEKIRKIGKTTIMLSVVTLVYVVSFIPFLGIAIHRTIYPSAYESLNRGSKMAYNVFFRFYLLNCAVNPIIYSFCNDLFRKECKILFRKLFRKTDGI